MILVVDNYDSFVHNLARYVGELGHQRLVVRNDQITIDDVEAISPSHIILSPGPCTPAEAGISNRLVRRFGKTTPILGVCLGHQCIGAAYGGIVERAKRPMHGKTCLIEHQQAGVFLGLPRPLRVTRYHSLIVAEKDLPAELRITARSEDGEIMGLQHAHYPVIGVQFHPEAVLTEHGHALLRNFLALPGRRPGT